MSLADTGNDSRVHGVLWGAAASDWADVQQYLVRPLWEAMLDALRITEGTRLLDAGCGAGGACELAVLRGAIVTGIDTSRASLAISRKRVPGGTFTEGDLISLPFPDEAFDAAFTCNVLQYCEGPTSALRELRRVCTSDGRIAIGIWGPPDECDMRTVFEAVQRALPTALPEPSPFALSGPGRLERMLEDAGLRLVRRGETDCPFYYADIERCWHALRSSGPAQAAIRAVGEDAVKAAVLSVADRYRTSGGGVRFDNRFVYAIAERI